MPGRVLASFCLTFVIMFLVPLPIHAPFVEMPEPASPGTFMLGVVVQKIGTALGFVLLAWLAREALRGRWLAYALCWWLMFAIVEIGQAIMDPDWTWAMSVAGIISEAVYCPLSSLVTLRLLAGPGPRGDQRS
jgi:hypothetical protein